jgi:hypothetical protein
MRQTDKNTSIQHLTYLMLFLAAVLCLVYAFPALIPMSKAENAASGKPTQGNTAPEILRDTSILPASVARMRSTILSSATTGNIESMRVPVDMNEIPPMLGAEKVPDPVAFWKKASGDGEGREMMAILVQLFRTGFVRKTTGPGQEMYIWPYFAEVPLDKLTPAQEVELLTLVSPARMKEMRAKGKYDHYRIGIGQDGVWHFFRNGEQQ